MKTLASLVLLTVLAVSNKAFAQNFDFRNTTWGMDSTQVKKAEKAIYAFSRKNTLIYNTKLGDLDARAVYNFNSSNQLYYASYMITLGNVVSKHPMYFVNNFLLLQDLLTQKYNEPYSKTSTTINGKVLKQDEWAANLLSDNLTLESKWKTDKTEINLMLFNINDELHIEITYTSIGTALKVKEENKLLIIKEL